MTYRQCFQEIYIRNKRAIHIYLCIALFLSIFFFHSGEISLAADKTILSKTESSVLGGSFSSIFLVAANNANIPLSPSVALSCSAILSIWGEYGTLPQELQNFSFGLMDIWFFRIFAFIWAAVSILPRCLQITHIGGLVIEDIEQKIGQVATFIVAFSQLAANINGGIIANASSTLFATPSVPSIINISLSFFILVLLLVCFLFIRTFLFFIDIIKLPICTLIPLTSVFGEIIKLISVIAMYALAIFSPIIYAVCYGVLLFISILFFKQAYISVRYFKNIYAKPFFRKFKGYDKEISLLHAKAPKPIVKKLADTDVKMLIPVYALRKTPLFPIIKRHDKWWLAVNHDGIHLFQHKPFKNDLYHIQLICNAHNKIFTKNSLRFFEIFCSTDENISGKPFRKITKQWHFVYSNEYTYRYAEIASIINSLDYNQYVSEHKEPKKLLIKQKFSRANKTLH